MMERIRYYFDNLFARGTTALLWVLTAAVVFLIAIVTLAMLALDLSPGPDATVLDKVWTVFTYTFDPTGVAYTDGAWGYRILMLIASLGGIFVLSLLVGILANGFADSVQTLRKGKSIVVESGHMLVLGWGEQIFSVIHELLAANANVKDACIVILAEHDKVDMEDAIRARVPASGNTRIVCRSGSPTDIADLRIVRPLNAKSILILDEPTDTADHADVLTIKVLLALMHLRGNEHLGSVVATVRNEASVHVAELVAGTNACIIPSEVIISQIITQTCRQPGLSVVYSELLDFDGDELYIAREPKVVGMTFAEAILQYETSSVVGMKFADGTVKLNPAMDTVIGDGDAMIVLSEDDDTVVVRDEGTIPPPHIYHGKISRQEPVQQAPESILMLGWGDRARFILRELDAYVQPGTTVLVVDEHDQSDQVFAVQAKVNNITVSFRHGSTTSREVLDDLNVRSFNSVMVLADTKRDVQEADARTLMTLIHLRDITGVGTPSAAAVNIVTEMLDERNRALAATDGINDFIISNTIVSLLLTQIAENRDLYHVFRDLFDAAGSELYLKPASDYVMLDSDVTFATVVQASIDKGEIAIGYKSMVGGQWSVRLNVKKSDMVRFTAHDMVVVISED